MKYVVSGAIDDPRALQTELNKITSNKGRVVSIIWTPARPAPTGTGAYPASYTIVSEFP